MPFVPMTDPERKSLAHMLAHHGRMLHFAAESPTHPVTGEFGAQRAANKVRWSALTPAEKTEVVQEVGPQKGATAEYLNAAIADLES